MNHFIDPAPGLTAHTLRARSASRRIRVLVLLAAVLVALLAPLPRTALAAFGVTPGSFHVELTNQEGGVYTQAGGHPFAFTTSFEMNTKTSAEGGQVLDGNARDAVVELPPGLIGNPQALPACHGYQVAPQVTCPVGAQVGVVALHLYLGEYVNEPTNLPLYNIVPNRGEPAAFAFNYLGVLFRLSASVRSSGDYGLNTTIGSISEEQDLQKSVVTFWGVPADHAHDAQRCAQAGAFGCFFGQLGAKSTSPPVPFLTLPSDCSVSASNVALNVDSWQQPGLFQTNTATLPPLTGCEHLSFEPSISVQPDSHVAGAPSGYTVDLKVPQDEAPEGLATPDLREAVVALPVGVSISPSEADGLQACTDDEIGIGTSNPVSCPEASKVGEVTIHTPLLSEPLSGGVYLGTQESSDPGSGHEFRIFLDAENAERGQSIRLEGEIRPDPVTGQLVTTFAGNPQLPFSDLTLHFKDGPRAPLSNPSTCGTYTTSTQLTPYGGPVASPSSSFSIDQGCATGGFSPAFSAGTSSNQAGGFSPFSVTFNRADADQNLGSIAVRAPEGLLGVLKSVPLCEEPQAEQGACGAGSLIGHTTVGAGPGSNPFYLGGSAYLTGPYKGSPFGLSIVVPAIAGPFNLGNVVVRAAIAVDPITAALTITSDPLPSILQGIPLQIRSVNVTVDRAGFMFNPTSCNPTAVTGTIISTQGASASVSSRFQAANCALLAFKPKFTASIAGKSSRASGAALDVKISSGAGQANIGRVAVSLPKALPSRLSTIQKACPQQTFAVNPASCPAGSLVGTGTAVTPILALPLSGPAYLVSHGGAAFPDLVVVLQGRGEAAGVTIDLKGAIDITKAGITSSTFSNVPDVPISSFELKLPTGPHSALTGNLPAKAKGSFCGQTLTMPTALTGHNGTQVKQSTKIAITGCTTSKAKKTKKSKGKASRATGNAHK